MKTSSKRMLQGSLLTLATALAACGGGGSGSGGGAGTMSFSVTDNPGDYEHVYVTISGIRVNQSASEEASGSGFEEITLSNPQRIDLLDLQNGNFTDLGDLTLPAGNYKQARLVLVDNVNDGAPFENAVVLKSDPNTEIALTTPSAQQSGLKVNIDVDVSAGEIADLRIDFDANKSVVQRGNSGQYNLKPVLRAVPVLTSGISGTVDTASLGATTLISLQQNGQVVASTTPSDTGSFRLSPIAPATNYDLVITSTGKATQVVTDVPVTEGAITNLDNNQTFVLADDGDTNTVDVGTISGTVSNDDNAADLRTTLTFVQTLASSDSAIIVNSLPLELVDGDSDPATDDASNYSVSLSRLDPVVAGYVDSGAFNFQPDGAGNEGQFTVRAVADYDGTDKDQTLENTADITASDQTLDFIF